MFYGTFAYHSWYFRELYVDLRKMWVASAVLHVKEGVVDLFKLKQNSPGNYKCRD